MEVNQGTIITRDFILDRLPEEQIFEKYLGFAVSLNNDFTNPLRADDSPGCRFYVSRKTGRLRFNDFSRGKSYDCFDIVKERFNLGFNDAILKIAYDFKLSSLQPKLSVDTFQRFSFLEGDKEARPIIKVLTRPFTEKEKRYWQQYGIKGQQLQKFNVFALQRAVYERGTYSRILFNHKNKELAFCYYIESQWKLYFPNRVRDRFYQVSEIAIQGYEHLPEMGDSVVITKSYKDVIGFDVYGIPAVAPQSENINLRKDLIRELKTRFDNIYILYDNDWVGKRAMVKRILEYPDLQPLCFAKGQPKDLTDNMKAYGVEYVGNILKQFIK